MTEFKQKRSGRRRNIVTPTGRLYTLYEGGALYSHASHKFLKVQKIRRNKRTKTYYAYTIHLHSDTTYSRKYYVERLIMFYFGQNEYVNIDDMPLVEFIDKDSTNFDIHNLQFTTCASLAEIARQSRKPDTRSKIKDTQLSRVKLLILLGKTNVYIAKEFDCSEMSVSRYRKRHSI